jgi:hypothetical protein
VNFNFQPFQLYNHQKSDHLPLIYNAEDFLGQKCQQLQDMTDNILAQSHLGHRDTDRIISSCVSSPMGAKAGISVVQNY